MLAACAGELENPERFEAPSTGPSCELDVVEDIFVPKCGACHGSESPYAGLDLVSDGHAERLVGVVATDENSGACAGEVRLDPADPEGSLFMEKLHEDPSCGTIMPQAGTPLDREELDCVRLWMDELIGMAGGGGDGGMAGGGDGGVGGGDDAGASDEDGGV